MKRIFIAGIVSGIILIGVSSMKKDNSDNYRIFIGMDKSDVSQIYDLKPGIALMVDSAQISQSYVIHTKNNIIFRVVFKNDRLSHISTTDIAYRTNQGAGVGTSLAELRNKYKTYNIASKLGYGRYVKIPDEDIFFYFIWISAAKKPTISDEEQVKWVELQQI